MQALAHPNHALETRARNARVPDSSANLLIPERWRITRLGRIWGSLADIIGGKGRLPTTLTLAKGVTGSVATCLRQRPLRWGAIQKMGPGAFAT